MLPLLLSVDWVLGRCRAMTNVVGDVLGAVLLDCLGAPPDPEAAEGSGDVDARPVEAPSLAALA